MKRGEVMKEFQNRNPLRRQADETTIVHEMPSTTGNRQLTLGGFLFLLVLVLLLGGGVYHYSRYSFSAGRFELITEESGSVPCEQENVEYERLLIRNRYPFVLTMTIQLCRSTKGDTEMPRLFVLATRYFGFTGTRSLFSGTFETHLNVVMSGDGRFYIADQPGTPQELLNMATSVTDESEQSFWLDEKQLPDGFLKTMHEDKIKYRGSYYWLRPLPGDHPDMFLLCTLTPQANYGR